MIDLRNPSEWNLIVRTNPSLGANDRLLPVTFTTEATELFIGIAVEDHPNWRWGGTLTQYVLALASSTNDLFSTATAVERYRLICSSYQAISLVEANPKPYLFRLEFPRWFYAATVEIFARNDI